MKKRFMLETRPSKNENNKLYKLYNQVTKNNNNIHNLTNNVFKVPFQIQTILWLGIKFCFSLPPRFKDVTCSVQEGMRKIGWHGFFYDRNKSDLTKFDKILCNFNRTFKPKLHSVVENELFPNIKQVINNIICKLKRNYVKESFISKQFLDSFLKIQEDNNIIIKPADKNAGNCIMLKIDYENEVMRQLDDLNTYFPSTKAHFIYKMDKLIDDVQYSNYKMPPELKVKQLLDLNYEAAKFYVLPKVHKEFNNFPKGRPISSTVKCCNRNFSKVLDTILQPIMNLMKDVLLDTTHFLLKLNEINLLKDRKYVLMTADIESLYPNLPIKICKQRCMEAFVTNKHKLNYPFSFNEEQLYKLLEWSLDYSFVEFNNLYYEQHKGIPMGSNSSVTVSNITVSAELKNMFYSRPEIVFNTRFIDDIFCIIDVTEIVDVNSFINDTLQHTFLKFTYEYSEINVNFLDLNVGITDNNVLETNIYRKPMSKHEYLHYSSNHPLHIKKSLPYSAGIRIIRCTSIREKANVLIDQEMEKFVRRSYPRAILNDCKNKLSLVTREQTLRPKQQLLLANLGIHDPGILAKYNVDLTNTQIENDRNKIFIVVPFYKTLQNIGTTIKDILLFHLNKCKEDKYKDMIQKMYITIAFKKTNGLNRYLKK